jgi:phage tail tape-measure protein
VTVGAIVGAIEGDAVGIDVGETVGVAVGVGVGAAVGEVVGESVIIVQTRSDTCDGAWLSNATPTSHAEMVEHSRSELTVGGVSWKCVTKSHAVMAEH